MSSQGQQALGSRMKIDENAEFTVVGLGSEGVLDGSYNVINEYATAKRERPGERGHWAYISIPNYDVFHSLVIGKTGENTVSDTNFNLQLGLTQLYIEAHAELKEAVRIIRDVKPESKAEQDRQDQLLKECRNNLHEITTGLRNSWDLQAALHVWRAHWQGGKPQQRFDQALYREVLDAWKLLRDKMGEADDLVGVGWLDSWIKGFLDVYSYEDDFYQQLLTWNMVHDVGDADFGHESIRLWQAEINKFRYKHRKMLDIESTMAGIKERMAQFRVMIMDPGSYHGWAAGGWYWQVKTDQFRSLATQLMDLDFRHRLQQQPESQHKFEELDRLALDIYKKQTIETCKKSKSLQAVQMIEIWHSTFGLLLNYDMICTGYLWSYIRSTSQMDTDVFILSYQDVEVKKGGWTCPITVDLIAAFQIGLRGFIKRRAESRARRKRNSRPKPKPSAQGEEEPEAASNKLPTKLTQEQKCSEAGQFEDAELIHDDGKRMELITSTSKKTDGKQSSEPAKHSNESETANIKKKKKKSSKKKPQTSAEGITTPPIPASAGGLMGVGTEESELAPEIKNRTERTDIDDAWQAAKQEFIGRTPSEDGSLARKSEENTGMAGFLKDAERSKMMDLPEVAGFSPPANAVSAFDWFDETNEPTASTNDEWYSAAKEIQKEGSQSRIIEDNSLKENKNKLRPGVQWSQIVGGGTKTNPIEEVSRPKKHKQVANIPKFPKAGGKSSSSVPRFDGQSQKKSNIASDRKGKGKAIAPSKEVPPPQNEIQGPIGHILPSTGPWTEVSKKRKQVVVVGGSENSTGRDRTIGKTKAKMEVEIGEVTKISGGPAVGEFKMKEISNLLGPSGKRQIVAKVAELDSQPAPQSVLRIVPKQARFPAPPTSPSTKTGTADIIKNAEVPASSLIISDVRPVSKRTVDYPSLNPPDGSGEDDWGGTTPVPSPDQSVQVKVLTADPPVVPPTPDQTVSVQYKTGQVAPITPSVTELPVPLSPTITNSNAVEECQTLLTIAVQGIVSPSVPYDTDVPGEDSDHSREGSKKGLDFSDEVFEGEIGSGESTDPTEIPGIH